MQVASSYDNISTSLKSPLQSVQSIYHSVDAREKNDTRRRRQRASQCNFLARPKSYIETTPVPNDEWQRRTQSLKIKDVA